MNAKSLVPAYVRNYLGRIQNRLTNLEAQTAIIFSQQRTIALLQETIDMVDVRPRYEPAENAGFNGQPARKRLFQDVLKEFDFELIVETGTWIGETTGYLADSAKVPVFTSEINHRFHSLARKRLVDYPNVALHLSDSRRFLRSLAENSDLTQRRTFFYLDAHWYKDLPLREELEIIADAWSEYVIMVDDFQVPGDDGYGFDNYGDGLALNVEYIAPVVAEKRMAVFSPSANSHDETGYHRRGCVVLAPESYRQRLNAIQSLRDYAHAAPSNAKP
jgi:hypothetical protein